ncbi:MAG: glycosyltransferase [Chloroflexota bacterium]
MTTITDTTNTENAKPVLIGELLIEKGFLTPDGLAKALELQALIGGRIGSILVSLGLVKRQQLYSTLADLWGYPFIDLMIVHPDPALAKKFDSEILIALNFIPVAEHDGAVDIAAAEKPTETLTTLIRGTLGPVQIQYFVTTEWDVSRVIRDIFKTQLLDRAVNGLYYRNPLESAYTVMTRWQFITLGFVLLLSFAILIFFPRPTLIALNLVINLGFTASILFKFATAMAGARTERIEAVTAEEVEALNDADLPVYSILVPCFKEANVVGLLMKNLGAIDYPTSKLQILLLLEENDQETQDAARAAHPPETVTFIVIPAGMPQTKPKACNVGLFFAKGEYLVIYDAEDRPEADQLKKAVVAFRKGAENLICVQAALNYFNANENFLTRMFTLEYSYWFDYMLSGLDQLHFPIPLGGTSNHFRTDMLRKLGGWDPFNVTEDADLGIRAAANKYIVGVINSTTYEEANNHGPNWIRQRSRWIKGYMQTVLVHLRDPIKLVREAGFRNIFGFIMLIAGTPITFLCVLPLWGLYLFWLITRTHAFDSLFPPAILYIGLFNLIIGNILMIYLNMLAVFKRRYYSLILFAMLNPFYWLMHSVASYKALWQLFTKPFFWEKTTHGISRQLTHPSPTPEPTQPGP